MTNDEFAFSKSLWSRVGSLRFDLNVLKVRASEDQVTKEEMVDLIYDLQEKIDNFEKRLQDLEQSGPQFWPKAKSLVTRAWEDASFSIEAAKKRYLH